VGYREVMGADSTAGSYLHAKESVEALPLDEQLRLVAEITDRLKAEHRPRRSLLELRGLGKSVWQSIDADEYLRRERTSWGG